MPCGFCGVADGAVQEFDGSGSGDCDHKMLKVGQVDGRPLIWCASCFHVWFERPGGA